LLALVVALALASATPAESEEPRSTAAAWTVAGASAAGFVGGALFAVPLMLSQPFGVEVGLAIGLPAFALGAAFGAFVAELGYARLSTSFGVAGFAGGGALLGGGLGVVAGFGVGSLAKGAPNDPAPILGAIAGGALGGIGGAALSGGLGALWLTPDER
jgi:hypothetical protein